MTLIEIRSVAAIFLFTLSLHAEVQWASLQQSITANPFDEATDFIFEFKIEGTKSVEFFQPVASCGCTVATLERKKYGPGERGKVSGSFKTGERRGANTVAIAIRGVELSGDDRVPFDGVLRLEVNVPQLVEMVPGITLWEKKDAQMEKTVDINFKYIEPKEVKLIDVSNALFAAKLVKVSEKKYQLLVLPVSTEKRITSVATMEAESINGKKFRFFAHFLIR